MTESISAVLKGKMESSLLNVTTSKIMEWQACLRKYAISHGKLYAVSDTETTGTSTYCGVKDVVHRVLEWSIIFCIEDESGLLSPCVDGAGEPIIINEPINPFAYPGRSPKSKKTISEIPLEAIGVHGITMEYLFGVAEVKDEMGKVIREKLKAPAPSFESVFDAVRLLLDFPEYLSTECPVIIVFHNSARKSNDVSIFDVRFLTNESEIWELPPLESFFFPIDTARLAAQVIDKSIAKKYSLDSLHELGRTMYPDVIKDVARPFHSSSVDSFILIEVYNTIMWYRKQAKDLMSRGKDAN